MTTKIYASLLSPFGARLRLALALKGMEMGFEPPPGGSGSAEMKRITPFGRIPALVQGDTVLVESLALLDYLEDSNPDRRSLRPADPVQLARVRMISLLFDHNVIKAMGGVFAQLLTPAPDAAAARAALDQVAAELSRLVLLFDPAGPAVGGAWSMADCAMAPFAHLLDLLSPLFEAESPTRRVPRFRAWWDGIRPQPEVAAVCARMEQGLAAMMAARKPAAA